MNIGLNVLERSTLLGILPKEGNIITLRLNRELTGKVGLSAEDFANFEIKTTQDPKDPDKSWTSWNAKGSAPTDIDFADVEVGLVRTELKKLDTAGKLNESMISLYEKFGVA